MNRSWCSTLPVKRWKPSVFPPATGIHNVAITRRSWPSDKVKVAGGEFFTLEECYESFI